MNNCAIVGNGMVGNATGELFAILDRYDTNPKECIHLTTLSEVAEFQYIFICLPTPTVAGNQQTDDIFNTIKEIEDRAKEKRNKPIYIIRSTVLPGFANKLMDDMGIERVVSNPEFLSEATWREDILNPDLIVIGGDNSDARDAVVNLYRGRLKQRVNTFVTDNKTAELIKYATNTFFATKVVFANQIYEVARELGANYATLKNALYSNSNIGKNHLDVVYRGQRGVRGKCLPKDLEAFAKFTKDPLLNLVVTLNDKIIEEDK